MPGVYLLKLKVQSWVGSEWGEDFINITVHEASHVNSPPVPVILPSSNAQVYYYHNSPIKINDI